MYHSYAFALPIQHALKQSGCRLTPSMQKSCKKLLLGVCTIGVSGAQSQALRQGRPSAAGRFRWFFRGPFFWPTSCRPSLFKSGEVRGTSLRLRRSLATPEDQRPVFRSSCQYLNCVFCCIWLSPQNVAYSVLQAFDPDPHHDFGHSAVNEWLEGSWEFRLIVTEPELW